jgi:Co/Zn/Cd efflux system component
MTHDREYGKENYGRPRAGSAPSLIELGPSPARRSVLTRRVRILVAATITYNVLEAAVALSAGAAASSSALIGFGLDSVIEVSSAAAVAWQFSARDHEKREAREHLTLRLIALSFFALAAFVAVDALRALTGADEARPSAVGIALAAVSLLVMPLLSFAQRRTGRRLGSASAVADSKQTLLCTYLSAVLLAGLLVNTTLGWSWADPLAALAIAAVAAREGLNAWQGDDCCPPTTALAFDPARDGENEPTCGCGPSCQECRASSAVDDYTVTHER